MADKRSMVELRSLAYFVTACQHESLARAAEHLGIALSTLSVSLKALEDELGLELFRRTSSSLYPTTAARWLFRAAAPVLLTEGFARRWLAGRKPAQPHVLTVETSLNFTLGRISNAILRAGEMLATEKPQVLIDPIWIAEPDTHPVSGIADDWQDPTRSRVRIAAADVAFVASSSDVVLLADDWVLACRVPAGTAHPASVAELFAGPVMIPELPRPLLQQAMDYCARHLIGTARFISEPPGALPRLFDDHPEAAFFIPGSVLSARLGLLRMRTVAPDPPLTTRIVAHADPSDRIGRGYIRHLRAALAAAPQIHGPTPTVSFRQVRYFNMLHRLRRVSAAAHGANIAQPALSEQLRKLEMSLGGALFERHSDGLVPTAIGERFAPIAQMLEASMREIAVSGASTFVPAAKRLALGVLPSVSQHGLLVNKIAEAVLEVRARHPALAVVVREAPNRILQDWVVRGVVGIAIVETSLPQMARLELASSEALAVIADPRHSLLPPGPVRFAQLADLPLALPTARFGLRHLLDAAAQETGLAIKPRLEIDALTMMAAVLAREPLCTVLPPSAVRRELAAGDLVAHPIIEPEVARRLFMIFSGDRSLTEAERDLVQTLRARLADLSETSSHRPSHARVRKPIGDVAPHR
ncbi:MAG: LysR family transcriptional regulator [Xanthobacteraceae bacterium]|nr:LysR family transcriptional regulator [Xanthobacteraceae bacterium]